MSLFEGKTTTERNKIIAAGVLGLVSLFALYMAFGGGFGGSSTATTVKVGSPTPKPGPGVPAASSARPDTVLPSVAEQNAIYESIPVVYTPGNAYAPDAGRNIFAFYEPPPPCKGAECPTPVPRTPTPYPTPTAAPTPNIIVGIVTPQSIYAGSKAFKLDINGERMVPDARVYFNQREVPTRYINPTQLSADIPAELIAREGPAQVMVQTKDGTVHSNQFIFTIMAPPRPTFQYIGMIGRKRYNNDTAYFTEAGRPLPYGARLNDVVGGRFRLIDMSATETVFEDVTLGFKHRVPITKAPTGTGPGTGAPFTPFGPGQPVPGFPQSNQPQQPPVRRPASNTQPDVDDNDGRP